MLRHLKSMTAQFSKINISQGKFLDFHEGAL